MKKLLILLMVPGFCLAADQEIVYDDVDLPGFQSQKISDFAEEITISAGVLFLCEGIDGDLYKCDGGNFPGASGGINHAPADGTYYCSFNGAWADCTLGLLANANDSVSPDNVLSTGQVDEYCLTYEGTGDTWEWQACAEGGAEVNDLSSVVTWATVPDLYISASSVTQHEASLEGVLDLQDLQGAVTDSQVPDDITITGLSGTNTGDQTITLTGDVTGSGTGSFAASIADNAVQDAEIDYTAVTLADFTNDAGYFDALADFTGTLTDGLLCTYDSAGGEIDCDTTPNYILDPGTVADNQLVRWSGTTGSVVDEAGLSISDPASDVVTMQLDDTSDALHLIVEPGADSAGLVVGRWTGSIPIGPGLGRYALFAEGPPAGPTYSHAIGAKAGASDQEVIHLYNSDGDHILRFNTESNDELEINGTTAAGTSQFYQVLGADPFTVFNGGSGDRVGTNDVTIAGTAEVTSALTVNTVPVVTTDFFGTLTDGYYCTYDSAGGEIDCNTAGGAHDLVTLAGEDYLTLSTQEITANAINPDNLAATDFGEFTCNGTTCSLDYSLTWTKERTISSPADADDYLWFKAEAALTLTAVNCVAQGTTPSITVDIQECDSDGASCASSLSSVITCNGGNDSGTISDSAVDSGDWIKMNLGTPSGTVDAISVQVNGTKAL